MRLANFFFGWGGVSREELVRAHDHARRAVSALQAVFFPEAFLQRMQLPVSGHAFDRDDVRTIRLDRKHRA